MPNHTNSKSPPSCDCRNGKGRDVIVITIETSCRRPCGASQKTHKALESDDDGKHVEESEDEVKPAKSFHSDNDSEHPSDEVNEMRSSPEPSTHTVAEQREPSRVEISEEKLKSAKTSEEDILVTPHSDTEVKVVPVKEHRLFKLPLLVERHHGPGCAMEISVIEKHDESCIYKKEEEPGRLPDDRVGSYECIGRLVFRTCNPNELESDSSGSQGVNGGFSGVSPEKYAKAFGGSKAALPSTHKSSPAQPSSPGHHQPPQLPPKSKSDSRQPSKVNIKQPKAPSRQPSRALDKSKSSVYDSPMVTPALSEYDTSPNRNKSQTVQEESIVAAKQEPLLHAAMRKKKTREKEHQIMVATGPSPYGHLSKLDSKAQYRGDDGKHHKSRNPLLLRNSQFNQIMTSKKMFPVHTDEGNQTDPISTEDLGLVKSKVSQETISSLTDLSKSAGKRRSSFLGSLFRRNSVKSSSITDSKRQFRR